MPLNHRSLTRAQGEIPNVRAPNLAEFLLLSVRSVGKPKTELPGDFARIAVADPLR